MTTAGAARAFPSPYSIETPAGCKGCERSTRLTRCSPGAKGRGLQALWFWNSMHFPVPMPPSTWSR